MRSPEARACSNQRGENADNAFSASTRETFPERASSLSSIHWMHYRLEQVVLLIQSRFIGGSRANLCLLKRGER
jgi:hypothetical protein